MRHEVIQRAQLNLEGLASNPPEARRASRAYLPRLMAQLSGTPPSIAAMGGIVALIILMLVDDAVRHLGLRLVPLYLPIICLTSWAAAGRLGLVLAVAAAVIAALPDVMSSGTPLGLETLANVVLRLISYIFLVLIVTAYRRTYDEADLRSMYDGLTGVLNKVSFEAAVHRQFLQPAAGNRKALLIYADLDDFKLVNDMHGHSTGDTALRYFAEEALRLARGSDLVGRLGGDEFGFLLTAESDQGAQALAHLVHQSMTTALLKTGLRLSCSMGGLIIDRSSNATGTDVLREADGALRRAKASGKATVITEVFAMPGVV